MEAMRKSAVIYARVSSTGDRQNTDRQVADLTAYADGNGYEVKQVFTEKISGAKKNTDRPQLVACLDYCENNGINTLLISELSRLGRNVWEVQDNVKRLVDMGVNVYFQKEGLNLFGADGQVNPFAAIMIAVLGTCAQLERDNISFRLNSGRANAIAKGVKMGRKVGSNKTSEQYAEQYPEVVKRLRKGQPMREVAKLCGVSLGTVQAVKKSLGITKE